mmetsp:Transcript_99379/g.286810  ORF Transcript_99379/g.286810 Transcript_99379/m.286810 type:complete len:663 (-) Transcript_99379:202-2190(-)
MDLSVAEPAFMAGTADAPRLVAVPKLMHAELCHRRLLALSLMAMLALGVEVCYMRLVPKFPPLYAALIRAAVWDCVLVGVVAAQMLDLSSMRVLAGIDSGHFLPLAVLLYHSLMLGFCAAFDTVSRSGTARARSLHRSFVVRRVLLELAGGPTGAKLYLGRTCFVVSGAILWLALRVIALVGDDSTALACFLILIFAAYCAAGLAATEVRHNLPGQLVQWLCTGWGAREAFLSGPLKMLGGLFLIPFAASVIIAQVWLRTLAFLIWLGVGCPCCRLHRADNVYDAFERELAVPLLQCSFLAFSSAISMIVLSASQMSGLLRTAVMIAAGYYTGMLLLFTAPSALSAKVSTEESFEASSSLLEDGQTRLLGSEHAQHHNDDSSIELEDMRSVCDELRALLLRERHDHSVEVEKLRNKLRDSERRVRAAERERQKAEESLAGVQAVADSRCDRSEIEEAKPEQDLPRVRWSIFKRPSSSGAASASMPQTPTPSEHSGGSAAPSPMASVPPPPPPPPPPLCAAPPCREAKAVALPLDAQGHQAHPEEQQLEQPEPRRLAEHAAGDASSDGSLEATRSAASSGSSDSILMDDPEGAVAEEELREVVEAEQQRQEAGEASEEQEATSLAEAEEHEEALLDEAEVEVVPLPMSGEDVGRASSGLAHRS